ncbi:MAG TPA: hypothetical protein PK760_04900, partial [Flavobacteriales bacterium]|nr:hypothetical protein [Flavobacteriales bacterium]
MSMLVPVILLGMALLILLWQGATEQAMRILKERAGIAHDAHGPRMTRVATWCIIITIVGFMLAPKKWFEPPPPMVATYGPDSLWMGMNQDLIQHIGGEREDLVEYGHDLISRTAYYLGPQ